MLMLGSSPCVNRDMPFSQCWDLYDPLDVTFYRIDLYYFLAILLYAKDQLHN